MIWALVVSLLWIGIACGMAVVVGRGIRLAEPATGLTDEIDRFLRESEESLTW